VPEYLGQLKGGVETIKEKAKEKSKGGLSLSDAGGDGSRAGESVYLNKSQKKTREQISSRAAAKEELLVQTAEGPVYPFRHLKKDLGGKVPTRDTSPSESGNGENLR